MTTLSSVQLLSHVWLFVTPWTTARQASLSISNSQSLFKLMSIEWVMPSNHQLYFNKITEAETPAPDVKSGLIRKDPDAGKDWGQEKKGATEDKMIGWYHWLNGHEFDQAPEHSEGQRILAVL